ncbi:putative L-carnitine dehydratase [Streptomyces albiflavescens]|uniref:L-carnitine dehydratase n=1 Tax=Streptomyces albiflavescens TaxID=1623582 RepID=A0A917Y765_9ACTN|nr:CoA transferase [Streptomyces albiflavescens]GGN67703.1 putative L-carnitine dehydratase [Streptomyces albiflavescens]
MTHSPMVAVWEELGGDPALLPRVSTVAREGALEARLPVRELARACVAACALAAAELGARRAGLPEVPAVRVDDGAVATAFVSERHLQIDGRAPVSFAPLSRFWRTADGWVRTHANYPHHRARLLAALGLADDATVADVDGLFAERSAAEVEETVYGAGGLAVALRTAKEWAAHEQGIAVAGRPLIERERVGTARVRVLPPLDGDPLLPAAGVRVLDLTRVIAGPVATRTLALLGADVLRVDAPRLPEDPDAHADTGFGKRSTTLDLATDRSTFERLLATADVVVTGYRPGALDRYGLSPEALAERKPGLIVAQLSAWGAYGPWGERRGFDSLVQVATGIAATEGSPDQPGALPAQALDHGTGYLLAAAVLRALTERSEQGDGRVVRLALARTAAWLTDGIEQDEAGPVERDEAAPVERQRAQDLAYHRPDAWLAERDSGIGRLRYALPPVSFAGGPADWARPPGPWGTDSARWA